MRVVAAFLLAMAAPSLALAVPANWGGHGGEPGHGGGHHGGGGNNGGPVGSGPDAPYPAPYPYPDAPLPAPNDTAATDAVSAPPPMPLWYYCDDPAGYYPYVKTCEGDWRGMVPAPPPPGAGPPLSQVAWDYCDDTKSYYPYVSACKHHWVSVPASTPDIEMPLDRPPPIAMWFYCGEPKGYYPHVHDCPQNWRMMPAVPPANVGPAPKKTAAVP